MESALKNAQIERIYVIFTAQTLDILANNATQQLVQNYKQKIQFRRIDLLKLFQDTPLERIYTSGQLNGATADSNAGYDQAQWNFFPK